MIVKSSYAFLSCLFNSIQVPIFKQKKKIKYQSLYLN